MSNKTQLQTNNTTLASIIQTLQGKAAGGSSGGVETCQVIVNLFAGQSYTLGYTTIDDDGNVIGVTESRKSGTISINCVCNTHITVTSIAPVDSCNAENAEVLYNEELSTVLHLIVVALKAQPEETVTVTIRFGNLPIE